MAHENNADANGFVTHLESHTLIAQSAPALIAINRSPGLDGCRLRRGLHSLVMVLLDAGAHPVRSRHK